MSSRGRTSPSRGPQVRHEHRARVGAVARPQLGSRRLRRRRRSRPGRGPRDRLGEEDPAPRTDVGDQDRARRGAVAPPQLDPVRAVVRGEDRPCSPRRRGPVGLEEPGPGSDVACTQEGAREGAVGPPQLPAGDRSRWPRRRPGSRPGSGGPGSTSRDPGQMSRTRTVPAFVPSRAPQLAAGPLLVRRRQGCRRGSVKPSGLELAPPSAMSFTRTVPADVPSLRHSSRAVRLRAWRRRTAGPRRGEVGGVRGPVAGADLLQEVRVRPRCRRSTTAPVRILSVAAKSTRSPSGGQEGRGRGSDPGVDVLHEDGSRLGPVAAPQLLAQRRRRSRRRRAGRRDRRETRRAASSDPGRMSRTRARARAGSVGAPELEPRGRVRARKYTNSPAGVMEEAPPLPGPGVTSATRKVPAGVPSLRQSSRPSAASWASK